MAIDTDSNSATTLLDAAPMFQIADHAFCWYFFFEWYVRFSSFAGKRNCLRDAWFVFDSCLVSRPRSRAHTRRLVSEQLLPTRAGIGSLDLISVLNFDPLSPILEDWRQQRARHTHAEVAPAPGVGGSMMVAETWVMTVVLLCLDTGGGGGMGGLSILRLFRLLRLSRLARMLRSMPELMILIKGVVASSRSVFCTMGLLAILLYVFAIAMRQLTDGTDVGELHFYSVPSSMYRLLIEGVFLDNLSSTVKVMSDSSPVFTIVFLVFVCIAALMVMNMLIGVLCEVVSDVAKREKEDMGVHALKMKLAAVMARLDRDGTGTLSEDEFVQIMGDATIVQLLDEVGVDPIGLIDMASTIFLRDDCDDEDLPPPLSGFGMQVSCCLLEGLAASSIVPQNFRSGAAYGEGRPLLHATGA
ncbi:unnamed protein product [Prorocentrum cordatum]|uniref:EF-hand domain-containing protein n=1 Tax=Prorocentrum cordatum TaxID=2364126 RepID=A0ABN9S3I4_9DINO|nr:unnamed protein product [Polarella glacialis]